MIEAYSSLAQASPLLIKGATTTLYLWISSLVVALSLGIVLGLVRCQQLCIPIISPFINTVTFILRAVPFYVQLLIAYFVIPEIIFINLSAEVTTCLALGVCSAAYVSQIIRTGINAIPQGQWEAAWCLGYTKVQTARTIILPQVMKTILPSLNGEFEQLLKSTAMASTIGILDLTGAAKNIIAREMNPFLMYTTVACCYVMISSLFSIATHYIEQRLRT